MTLYFAQVNLASTSGINEDVAVNGYHFRIESGPALTDLDVITGQRDGGPDVDGIQGSLSALYVSISQLLGVTIDPLASRIKWYNLDLPKPRFPVAELPLEGFIDVGNSTLPQEVAIVSSFQAERVSGLSQARRRNRVYLGPIVSTSIDPNNGRIPQASIDIIRTAFVDLAQASSGQAAWIWVVYSPTTNDNHAVKSGWIDNAFDTQRRRGLDATVRDEWTEDAG